MIAADGRTLDSPSPFAASAMKADIAAFTALMCHLKIADPQRTVITGSGGDEPGVWAAFATFLRQRRKFSRARFRRSAPGNE